MKISSIEIKGNEELSDSKLKASMKDTKEKSFFVFGKGQNSQIIVLKLIKSQCLLNLDQMDLEMHVF